MGHDIYGRNNADEDICYMRFSMGNFASYQFYEFFDAMEFHGGVSGLGQAATYTTEQIEKALASYQEIHGNEVVLPSQPEDDFETYERKEMLTFIMSCLKTAREEGSVRVLYC